MPNRIYTYAFALACQTAMLDATRNVSLQSYPQSATYPFNQND